jgi:4-diphosphocytidyl-2-C-methyl-D-erythritol kinase
MNSIKIKCPAKINLSLDVVGKRQDGYHLVSMLMQSISLFDDVSVEKGNAGIRIYCEKSNVPCNESNTAFKTAKLVIDKFGIKDGVNIYIDKRIPVAAGLAGGSTDAAGVIYGLNKLFDLNMTIEDMMAIGLRVGADVPFCISGGTVHAEGIGEILKPLAPLKELWCVLSKPPVNVSTKEVYSMLRIDEIPKHPDTAKLIEFINRDDDRYWKLGVFYYNPDDPSLFIEKRFGIGWTSNFGRPMSWVLFIGLIVLIVLISALTKYLGA